MDIRKAIEIEQDYVQNRVNNIDDCLVDKLSKLEGFTTLEDYFQQKRDYLIQQEHCHIEHCNIPDIPQTLSRLMNSDKASLLIVPSDRYFIYHGNEPYNKEFCRENNFYICEIGHSGGTIVVSPKDISFGIMIPLSAPVDEEWILEGYVKIFKKYGYDVYLDNNDILIDGVKVLGSAMFKKNGLLIHVCNISFENTTDLINKICLVKRIKEPGYIQAPLTREQLTKEVIEWLQAR